MSVRDTGKSAATDPEVDQAYSELPDIKLEWIIRVPRGHFWRNRSEVPLRKGKRRTQRQTGTDTLVWRYVHTEAHRGLKIAGTSLSSLINSHLLMHFTDYPAH